ncbi:TIGR03826 family flagellar region protein [Planococcus sp. 4-30]|uniref:TIGR03826 family flagellar region protein n=1 Tax=Planococcus sp. 4-30 TaxID=2874583 RepID=UPI001CBB5BD1|nr:TIGR03826 family flagellar region protein [Planococcus sp. 4-30]
MQASRLENCSICGRLFNKSYSDYCLDCYKDIEQQFKLVAEFLKAEENRRATIAEVSEAVDVSKKRIKEFIRDGRLYAADYPNLGYPCSQCGKVIKRDSLCTECATKFSTELNKSLQADQFREQMAKNPVGVSANAQYWKLRK